MPLNVKYMQHAKEYDIFVIVLLLYDSWSNTIISKITEYIES